MMHYICDGGCKGESDTAGVCQAADCTQHGEALKQCACEDRQHVDAKDSSHDDVVINNQ